MARLPGYTGISGAYHHNAKPTYWMVCDFETNTNPDVLRENPVWAWGLARLGSAEVFRYGTTIDTFMDYLRTHTGFYGIYFHNLNFDGEFIISWLLRHGWEQGSGYYDCHYRSRRFWVLRNRGKLYEIQFAFEGGGRVVIWDSLKKLPMKVSEIPAAFGLETTKGDIDYGRERKPGYRLTQLEKDYLRRDIAIVSVALGKLEQAGFTMSKLTTGSAAYADWRNRAVLKYGKDLFNEYFPELRNDEWLFAKRAYCGGICLVNPVYQGRTLQRPGRVYDVNSMYPSVMRDNPMPVGKGKLFFGKPDFAKDKFYIFRCTCDMALKSGQQAVYRPRGYPKSWRQGDFTRDSFAESGLHISCIWSNIDYHNYSQHYDITVYEWIGGYEYDMLDGVFADYVDYWGAIKQDAAKHGDKGRKQCAKYMLNNVYGKFGQDIDNTIEDICTLLDDGTVKWVHKHKDNTGDSSLRHYIPIAVAITSYARAKLCEMIRAAGDRFVYADTDSVHVLDDTGITGIDCDPYRLGAWDCESHFIGGKWLRAKAYAEVSSDGSVDYKLAGCPKAALYDSETGRPKITLAQFAIGLKLSPKLVPKRCCGGVVLVDVGFELRERPNLYLH